MIIIIRLIAALLTPALMNTAGADAVQVVAAEFSQADARRWSVNVTLKHADSGWDHYADRWRIVDAAGRTLGERMLYHPHVGEQPFTRGLDGVLLPEGATSLFIEAHDTVHGWAPNSLPVDLGKASSGRLKIETVQNPE